MIKIISNFILLLSFILTLYMLIDISLKKQELKNEKIEKINNNKYIIILVTIIILFIIHGILRNF